MTDSIEPLEGAINFATALNRDRTRGNLERCLRKLTREIGISGFTWWFGSSLAHYDEIDTRPKKWMEEYDREGYFRIDPISLLAATVGSPFRWKPQLEQLDLSPQAEHFMERAADYGMADGCHFPVGIISGKWGCLSFFGTEDEAEHVWESYKDLLTHISIHINHFSHEIGMAPSPVGVDLSPTERDTMIELIMDGATRKKVSENQGRGVASTDTHVKRALQKLEAKNVPQAAFKMSFAKFLPFIK